MEIADQQRELEAKQRALERLETVKKLKAAKARRQVYEQSVCSDEEIHELLHQDERKNEVKHEPKDSHSKINLPTQTSPPQVNTTDIVKALAESISASRLPVP